MKLSTALIKKLGTIALLLSPEGKWGLLKGIDAKGPKRKRQKKEAKSPKGGKSGPDECTIDRFTGNDYYYNGGCGGMTFVFSIKCEDNILEDGGCTFTEVSQDGSCGFNSYTFDPKHYIREDEESGDCILGSPFLPIQPRDETESCAKSNLSIQFVAEKGVGPTQVMDIYFSDDYGWVSKRGPYEAYHVESDRVRKLKLQSDKHPLVAFHEDSQRHLRMLEGTCGCGDPYSDGAAGDLEVNQDGVLTLGGVSLGSEYSAASGTIGTAFDATTIFDNIDNFIIPEGLTVNVLGTVIVRAKHITIEGTLDGTGGGYPGGASVITSTGGYAPFGESPPYSNGEGGGGIYTTGGVTTGGGGGGHGGAGGRGGAQSFDSTEPYCDDNARSGIYGGDFCSTASYSGCCNEGGSPGNPYEAFLPGSGGGAGPGSGAGYPGSAGGNGGAAILLYSTEITLNGSVKANGGGGTTGGQDCNTFCYSAGGGGGSGGSILITACTVTTGLSASIQAKGGDGGGSFFYLDLGDTILEDGGGAVYGGGSGSGGIVSLEAETLYTADNNEVTIEVDAGLAGDEDSNSTAGFKGSDGKVYGIYQPSSQPSSQPTEEDLTLTIFVTSVAYQGNLGGVSGADKKCQDLADIAGLDGIFKAWISSDSSSSPAQSWSYDNPNRPYYLVDGTTKVADDWNHLFTARDYELHHAINQNENGQTVTEAPLRAWTNTNWNGNRVSTHTCYYWSKSGSDWKSKYGWIEDTGHHWSWKGEMKCNWLGRLYCIQQSAW